MQSVVHEAKEEHSKGGSKFDMVILTNNLSIVLFPPPQGSCEYWLFYFYMRSIFFQMYNEVATNEILVFVQV
jgi:hypothetical protein